MTPKYIKSPRGEEYIDFVLSTIFLKITSFRGISLGASHYYGTLRAPCNCSKLPCGCKTQIQLERKLTASQAKELTKLQNDGSLLGFKYTWKSGDETSCFDSKEDIKQFAVQTWRQHFPSRTRLVLGDPIENGYEILDVAL